MIELITKPTGAIELTKPTGSGSGVDMGYINNTFCNALKGMASGEVVSITDAAPMEHTVSASVESKNILPFPYTKSGVFAMNGITFTINNDGTITANGTATNYVYLQLHSLNIGNYSELLPIENGTYRFSGCPTGGGDSTYRLQFNYYTDAAASRKYINDIGNGNSVVISGNAPRYDFMIIVNSGVVCNNLVFKPQVEKGTVATSYTPHIKELANVKVLAMGKNWYNSTLSLGGIAGANGEIYATNARLVSDYIEAKENTVYTISGIGDLLVGNRGAYDENKNFISLYGVGAKTPVGTRYIRFHLTKADNTQDFSAEEMEAANALPIQLELGTTATEYTPYKEPVEVGETFTSYEDMVITTDTVGAIVNVDYNRDINKAFAAIAAATMGANL